MENEKQSKLIHNAFTFRVTMHLFIYSFRLSILVWKTLAIIPLCSLKSTSLY